MVEAQRVIQRVAPPPDIAGLGAARPQVDGRELQNEQHPRPGRDSPVDRGQPLGVRGVASRHTCATARAAALAQLALLAQLSAAQPVVEAPRVPGLGQDQVHEHHAKDHVGAALIDRRPIHEPERQDQADESSQPSPKPNQERDRGDLEDPQLGPKGRRAIPPIQQRIARALGPGQDGRDVEEPAWLVADPLAVALELAAGEVLPSRAGREQTLVGEQEFEMRGHVVDVEQQHDRKRDPKRRHRAGIFGAQPEFPPALVIEHDDRAEREPAGEQQPANRGPERQRFGGGWSFGEREHD